MTAQGFLNWVAQSRFAAIPLLLIAIAERIGWSLAGHMQELDTELRNAAISWAHTGVIADAFAPGSGPSAHVGALPPLIPGIVFRFFGDESVATTLTLTTLSACVIVATALVLNRVFARLGTPAALRGAALLIVCVVPLHIEIESRSLRVYENGTAALLLGLLLLAVVRIDQRATVTWPDMLGLSGLVAIIFALSPTVAFCAVAVLGVLALRRLDWAGRGRAVLTLGIVLTATALPWALRNRDVMGQMIWSRDNFGLEFAVGTHLAALNPVDPGATYLARLAQIHPHGNPVPYRAMQAAGGEIAYARKLEAETRIWVAAHPVAAMTIWLRHLREFYFPPLWMWFHSAAPDATMPVRALIVDLIAVLGLFGIGSALARREWLYLYFIPPLAVLPLPYLLTQPLVRYRYVIASLLVFLAFDGIARLRRKA